MNDSTLKSGSSLQGGKYIISSVLGHGGFGITYEAEQVSLGRKVAVKEFFMKDSCERDESTSYVTVPTASNRDIVSKFRDKFLREARMIAALDHDHIVKIHDVFEENGTAYYVMEYLGGGSLDRKIKDKGAMPEDEAVGFIRQIADALSYLHSQNILHFDIKPSNVLLGKNGSAKLIDFGISKHYDEAGVQTSSTPVGISKGYAPLEQYQQGSDIKSFTPATDIYALGATLYALLTGSNPPEASVVNEDGLPIISGVSPALMRAIEKAMQPRRKERPQSVKEFLALLDGTAKEDDNEETVVMDSGIKVKNDEGEEKARLKGYLKCLICAFEVSLGILIYHLLEHNWVDNSVLESLTESLFVVLILIFTAWLLKICARPSGNRLLMYNETLKVCLSIWGVCAIFIYAIILMDAVSYDSGWASTILVGLSVVLLGAWLLKILIIRPSGDKLRKYNSFFKGARLLFSCYVVFWGLWLFFPVDKNETIEAIDLGLSVKWATCNMGANSPEDYGNYYYFGDTKNRREDLLFDLYEDLFCINHHKYDDTDNIKQLDLSDDVAHVKLGGKWRMPTDREWTELRNKCTWVRTTHGGYKITSKINGNSIFLPAAGERGRYLSSAGSIGYYWSSSLSTDRPTSAYSVSFDWDGVHRASRDWFYQLSVRPVSE